MVVCCRLQVASEDTVLYTVQEYHNRLTSDDKRSSVLVKLVPLIRCQHLSMFWLGAAVLSPQTYRLVINLLQPKLKAL